MNIHDFYLERYMYKGILESCERIAIIENPKKFKNFKGCHRCGKRLKDLKQQQSIVCLYIAKKKATVFVCSECYYKSATDMRFFNKE